MHSHAWYFLSQVDFLQRGDAGEQQAAAAASKAMVAANSGRPVRTATAVVDGQAKQFSVEYMGRWGKSYHTYYQSTTRITIQPQYCECISTTHV
jgi:hypothetical protein